MYSQHLGLSQDPFSIAPDPRFLFMSDRHREALAHLLFGVTTPDNGASSSGGAGGGFVLLTGEIGTGKTTICRGFLEQIPANCHVAYIFNPKLTVSELLQSICEEFHIQAGNELGYGAADPAEPKRAQGSAVPSLKQHIDALNVFLLTQHAAGKSCILIIDEAQNLMPEVLEQLRLLTNLETNERKLLQIVLIGQPELRTMLNRPELEQLAQRVIARYHLNALNGVETGHYIAHRMAVAGYLGTHPFEARAVARIQAITRGVPRRINLLCGRALLGAWATGQQRVDRSVVDKAALEVFGPDALAGLPARMGGSNWTAKAWWATLVVLTGVAVIGGVAFHTTPASWLAASRWGAVPVVSEVLPTSNGTAAAPAAAAAETGATGAASATPAEAALPRPDAHTPVAAVASAEPAQTAVQPPPEPINADALLPRLSSQQTTAWQALGALWSVSLEPGNPCQTAALLPLQCLQTSKLTLPQLRQLGRPGIMTLALGKQRPVYALLVGLGTQTATLQVNGEPHVVRLASLARLWQGDFATLWQPPAGFLSDPLAGSSSPAIDALASLLSRLEAQEGIAEATDTSKSAPTSGPQRLDSALQLRVRAFQRTQGLVADGRPGPLTFMQLESALLLNKPRLLSE